MFRIADRPEFTHTVTVSMPVDGGFEEQSFKARFALLPSSEVDDLKVDTAAGMKDFLRRVIVSFDDIVNDAGDPIPYSDKLRDTVLDQQPARLALFRTYFAAVSKAKSGN